MFSQTKGEHEMRERRRKQTMALDNITVRQAYTEFMREKKAFNLATETLNTYKLHIENFVNSNDFWDMPTSLLNKDLYQFWIEDMQEDENKKDVTVTSYCRSVRAFLYWLQDNQYMEPCSLKLPKYQKTIKQCYTDDELSILLKKPKVCSEVEYQSWVFINLVCATGMRLSSALSIKVSDIQRKEHSIYVQKTKNRNAQVFFVSDEMLSILSKYIIQFELVDDDWLFCTAEKNQLAKRTIQDNVADYNRKRGVSKTGIHLMRHTFAKNYYIKTKDMYSLQKILGHSTIATTEKYLTDLGVSLADATAYNPQQEFGKKQLPKKRRGKITVK